MRLPRGGPRRRRANQGIVVTGGPGQPPQPPTHGQVQVGQSDDVARPTDDLVPPDTGEQQLQHVEVDEEVFATPRCHSDASFQRSATTATSTASNYCWINTRRRTRSSAKAPLTERRG